jgi:hypothetical protein
MDPSEAQEISQRDQLWASLRLLRDEINLLGAGEYDASERQQKIIMVLARVVSAELDFRARQAPAEPEPEPE